MTVLLDTNIIMDALQERTLFDVEAKEILKRAQNDEIECCITANSITDIFYIYNRARNEKTARQAISFLLDTYTIISVTGDDCKDALDLAIEDYEDAVVVACALKAKVDYIVTRNEAFINEDLPIKTITPKDFLTLLQ